MTVSRLTLTVFCCLCSNETRSRGDSTAVVPPSVVGMLSQSSSDWIECCMNTSLCSPLSPSNSWETYIHSPSRRSTSPRSPSRREARYVRPTRPRAGSRAHPRQALYEETLSASMFVNHPTSSVLAASSWSHSSVRRSNDTHGQTPPGIAETQSSRRGEVPRASGVNPSDLAA